MTRTRPAQNILFRGLTLTITLAALYAENGESEEALTFYREVVEKH